jgi:hypothetical protein
VQNGIHPSFSLFSSLANMDKPQIILHSQKSVNYTVFDVKWIPTSAKFISLGNHARGTGALDIFEITHGDIALVAQVEKKHHRWHVAQRFAF